jgi:anti-sigma-K factor RskA
MSHADPPEPRDVPDEPADLLAAYALDAVDDLDAARVERHVATDPAAQAQLDRYHDAITGYAENDLAVTPPEEVWTRIAARTEAGSAAAADVPRRRWRVPAIAAAAVIAALGAGVVTVTARSTSPAEEFAEAFADPDNLAGTITGAAGDARVVVEPDGDGRIDTSELSPLDDDETYQLWLIGDGAPVSLGVLADGIAGFSVSTDDPIVALSIEPAGGSEAPTLPIAGMVGLT